MLLLHLTALLNAQPLLEENRQLVLPSLGLRDQLRPIVDVNQNRRDLGTVGNRYLFDHHIDPVMLKDALILEGPDTRLSVLFVLEVELSQLIDLDAAKS
jgi:hypothetical protein